MAPITTLLSQYQLLLMLCDTLSTADILSLGATSRENHAYIYGSNTTFDKLLSTTHCSGKGIVDQARVFGEWRGDPSTAKIKCLGEEARPCSDCGVRVCNVGHCAGGLVSIPAPLTDLRTAGSTSDLTSWMNSNEMKWKNRSRISKRTTRTKQRSFVVTP